MKRTAQALILGFLLAAGIQALNGHCFESTSQTPALPGGFFHATFVASDDEVEGMRGAQIAVDAQNNIYIVGHTKSADFPATKGLLSETYQGGSDIFVAKYDPQLKKLLAATFLGGSGDETESAVVLDDEGNLYVAGMTTSNDFPANAKSFRPAGAALPEKARLTFMAKISGDLSRLLGAAVISAETDRRGGIWKMIHDPQKKRLILAGNTSAADFAATPGAFQLKYGGGRMDEFVAVLNPALSEIVAATYLGGSDYDSTYYNLGLDGAGFIFIGGNTVSKDFPVTARAYQKEYAAGGGYAGHVSKLSPDLSALAASTYVSVSSGVFLYCMTVDPHGHVVFAGHAGPDMPTTPGAYRRTFKGIPDASNVGLLSNDLSELLASTFISGGGEGSALGGFSWFSNVMADAQGNIFVLGQGGLPTYPTTVGAVDETLNGGEDIVITKLDHGLTRILASTFLGGSGNDRGGAFLLDKAGDLIVAGSATTPDFPVGPDAFDRTFERKQDVFVAKFGADLAEVETPAVRRAAAAGNRPALERILKEKPALGGEKDRYGRTLLHTASRFGRTEVLDLLLKASPDINAPDENGYTPLHLAVLGEHSKTVEALLAGQANPSVQNRDGDTPLHIAAHLGNEDIVNLLAERKADLEARNKGGQTALHRAVFSRQKTTVEALLGRGADIKAKSNNGFTPLHFAVIVVQNGEIVARLVKGGAPANEPNVRGETPLHFAAQFPDETNWPELLKANPDVNARDNDGVLALHHAAYRNRVELVKEMLKRGVDVSAKDKKGKTALDVATEAKRTAIIELLKK